MHIATLKKKIMPILTPYQVTRVGLFGSFARKDAHPKSDIDLLVEIKKPVSIFGFVRLRHELEDAVGRKVDLVEYSTVKPALRKYILRDLIPLYGKGSTRVSHAPLI